MMKLVGCIVVALCVLITGFNFGYTEGYSLSSVVASEFEPYDQTEEMKNKCIENTVAKKTMHSNQRCRNSGPFKRKLMNWCNVSELITKNYKSLNIRKSNFFRIVVKCIDSLHEEQLSF